MKGIKDVMQDYPAGRLPSFSAERVEWKRWIQVRREERVKRERVKRGEGKEEWDVTQYLN